MIITIKNIEHIEKVSQNRKNFTSCRITVWSNQENKDVTLSGFGSSITRTWNIGDSVDVDVAQNAKGYWDFKENANSKPSENPTLKVLKEISAKLDVLIDNKNKTTAQTKDYNDAEKNKILEEATKAFG